MKKISARSKIKILGRVRRLLNRRNKRPTRSYNAGHTAEARAQFSSIRARLPAIASDISRYPGYLAFIPPKILSFSENYNETLAFIMDFRKQFMRRGSITCEDGIRRQVYADFAAIERIGPGAGLVLAAEVHRFSQVRGRPLEVHDHLWAEGVRNYFLDAGLFDLLHVDPRSIVAKPTADALRSTLKFSFGRTSRGRDAKSLISGLQDLAGHSVGPRPAVYAAISEALTNVLHAYPPWFRSWPYRTSKQWWASGFWSPSSKTVGLQLYDQGAGIPATLPKQTFWPKLLRMIDSEGSPSGLIAAAMQYGRTSTGQAGRGKGLAEMSNWIETTGSGYLRILSGGGEVTYRPGSEIAKRNFDAPFCGTLVQWEIKIED